MTHPPVAAASRRKLLRSAGALAALGGVGGLPAVARAIALAPSVAGHRPALVPTPATLAGWLKRLHDFGPVRATGTAQCRAFEEFLAAEFAKLGCTIERDRYRLSSWECSL